MNELLYSVVELFPLGLGGGGGNSANTLGIVAVFHAIPRVF